MGEQSNPYDVLEATKDVVRDLNRALYGDPQSRTPGLFDKVDTLIDKMDQFSSELERLKRRHPNITNWVLGYVTHYASIIFAIVAILNSVPGISVGSITSEVSAALAVVLGLLALVFLLVGYGWIGGE